MRIDVDDINGIDDRIDELINNSNDKLKQLNNTVNNFDLNKLNTIEVDIERINKFTDIIGDYLIKKDDYIKKVIIEYLDNLLLSNNSSLNGYIIESMSNIVDRYKKGETK